MAGRLDLLGYCPDCGMAVFESSDYYHDEEAQEFWHTSCLPESERGYQ